MVNHSIFIIFKEKGSKSHTLSWPPHSPNLTINNFFLWGHLKANVYKEKPGALKELKTAIKNQIALIND